MENITQADKDLGQRSTTPVNFSVPSEIHRAAKIAAASAIPPVTLRQWMADAIREKLEREESVA